MLGVPERLLKWLDLELPLFSILATVAVPPSLDMQPPESKRYLAKSGPLSFRMLANLMNNLLSLSCLAT